MSEEEMEILYRKGRVKIKTGRNVSENEAKKNKQRSGRM